MKINRRIIYLLVLILILAISLFCFLRYGLSATEAGPTTGKAEEVIIPTDYREEIAITSGATFGVLMAQAGWEAARINGIYQAALPEYDLAKIKAGHVLELTFDYSSRDFKELVYKIDSEEELAVDNMGRATLRPIAYEVRTTTKSGEITTSLYEAALQNGIDERAVIELANAFQWTIDFAMDPRVGDRFKFIYEERYLDGEYQMPGKILAGQYINDGTGYQVYYFAEDDDNVGYFDENGNSVQKLFLKAPVAFKYISSGFTTGARYIEAFNISTGHRAIDYAAAAGTPIRAVGDGTVILASYNGSYGNMVKIRHNGTYQTNYGHMSRFAVKRGEKVEQGQVIGYVGSTGLSTGPHLHYEMEKNGVKINPLREVLPPGQAIKDENKERFLEEIKPWQTELGL